MPLNEHEQKILDEIEKRFYEEDPTFATAVRSITPRTRFALSPKVAIGVLVVGLSMLSGIFLIDPPIGYIVAIVGFVLMVWSATALVQELRNRPIGDRRGSDTEDG
ncbi:MAG: DUF3040 domain-containing protein [Acidimicrobiia bacterium]